MQEPPNNEEEEDVDHSVEDEKRPKPRPGASPVRAPPFGCCKTQFTTGNMIESAVDSAIASSVLLLRNELQRFLFALLVSRVTSQEN